MSLKKTLTSRTLTLLVGLTLLNVACIGSFGQRIPKALIITGNGNLPDHQLEYPPWVHEFQNEMVVDILSNTVSVEVTEDLTLLNRNHLAQYDLVISNSLFLTPSKDQLQALHDFVSGGKSYLTLHCGVLSLLNWEKYEPFIGGIFIGGPSSEPEEFKVVTENHEFWGYSYAFRNPSRHPVSRAVDDFTIQDELYYFQPSVPDLEVIARAENHPVMWWHPFGKGKVMSLTLGHDAAAKSNPGYRELLLNGVRWLTGVPLLFTQTPKPFSNRDREYPDFLALEETQTSDSDTLIKYSVDNFSDRSIASVSAGKSRYPNLKLTGKPGQLRFTLAATSEKGFTTRKEVDIRVVADGSENLAAYYGNSVRCSSSENESSMFNAMNIIDNDTTTRWSSAPGDTAWVVVDLQKIYSISRIGLMWEASYATAYKLLGSDDGRQWNMLWEVTNGDGLLDEARFPPARARYIKVLANRRANEKGGYSIYELQVFER